MRQPLPNLLAKLFFASAFVLMMTLNLDSVGAQEAGAKKPSETAPLDLDDTPKKPVAAQLDLDLDSPEPKPVLEKVAPEIQDKIKRAEILEKKPDFAGVINLLKPFTASLPRSALLILARAYAVKEPALEVRTLELCLAKSPKDYVVKTALGLALARAQRKDDAVATLKEAREWNQKYPPVYDALANVLESMGDRYEARSLMLDKIKIFGGHGSDYTTLCRLFTRDDFLEKSAEVCQTAVDTDANTPENYILLSASLRDLEKKDQATQVLEKAAARFPASESLHSAAGEMKIGNKDYVSAFGYFKQAVHANPKSVRAQLGLANSAFELQKNQESLDAFQAACRLDRLIAIKDFSGATAKLRTHNDHIWMDRFESKLIECQDPQ